jgi:hypothetical protein
MMRQRRYLQAGWTLLLTALLLGLVVRPVGATGRTMRTVGATLVGDRQARASGSTSINGTIYVTKDTLVPIFQSNIEAQVPGAFNSAINSMVSKLPPQDQSWALLMANTLLQPSVSLVSLTPQQNGLLATIQLRLYNGDPKPINASMLISFSVLNSSTVQVMAKPVSGSPALVNGPVASFQVPIGQLNSIATTPTCGASTLALHMLLPVSLASQTGSVAMQGQGKTQTAPLALNAPMQPQVTHQSKLGQRDRTVKNASASTKAYVEIPASSLAQMGNSIGSMPFGNMTAQNIQISVQGQYLVITSDVYLNNSSFKIGTAVTTMVPTASSGNLAVNVLSTTFNLFGIFSINENSYNQQIEQTINSKLDGALAGKFNVTAAGIGPNSQIPCVASDSLLLTGTTSLG